MTAPARTRSRSRVQTRRPAHRTRGGLSPRVVVFGTVAVIALIVGAIFGAWFFQPEGKSSKTNVAVATAEGVPAAEVVIPTEDNPGPVRTSGGVPSGFVAGETGAIAAASSFAQTAARFAVRSNAETDNAARKLLLTGSEPTASFSGPVSTIRERLTVGVGSALRPLPLGSRIKTATPERASIEIWLAVFSANPNGTQTAGGVVPSLSEASFFTVAVDVARSGGDWRLRKLAVAEGPGVALGATNVLETKDLIANIDAYQPFGYIPPTRGQR